MQGIPIRRKGAKEYDLFIVLEDENLARMKEYDPAEIEPSNMGAPWNGLRLRRILLCYANPEDAKLLPGLIRDGRGKEVMDILTRGWRFRPELGDHDGPYINMGAKPS